ncbi:MAG: PilC/PilY family type IV pilus protein, partial [Chromatiales bacterium]
LDDMDINKRIMVTYNGSKGLAFSFPADYTDKKSLGKTALSSEQVADLLYNAPYSTRTNDARQIAANEAYGEDLVAYFRGDKSKEGTGSKNFRKREQLLGDIIHSSPVYVADPDPELYPDSIAPTGTYQIWANNLTTDDAAGAKGRQPMVYVGANDGALHAFNASIEKSDGGGKEVFAYYPRAVFSSDEKRGLHWLASPSYDHRYYVDIAPVVGEIYDATESTWKTILVGGLRGGGKAVYAIDVSDPSEFDTVAGVAGNILWEFTDDKLGYTYSKPTIAKLNNGRWAAIFGNGYNQSGDDADGYAALFIKYLDKSEKDKTEYVILTTRGTDQDSLITKGGDCLTAGSDCNGLSTPAVVDLGADRVADRVYAGDIKGNMWAFDISSDDPVDWKVAYGSAAQPLPLFKASDGSSPQPITSQPVVTLHPTERHSSTNPNTMVFFGTGQYMVETDTTSKGVNTFYGIWDSGEPVTLDRTANSPSLVEQTASASSSTLAEQTVRLMTNNPVDYSKHKGWYCDLPAEGERVISSPLVYGQVVLYTTIVPSSDICSDSAGESWLMVHNFVDGSEPDYIALDVSGDGNFTADDQLGDSNVAGVKSDSLYWQPEIVKSGPGSIVTILVPSDDEVSGTDNWTGQGVSIESARTSWGLFQYE